MFPPGCGDPRVDLALEEAGLTPGLAESTLLLGCLGDTQGAWLRDESPVAWDEIDSLLYSLQEILLRWLQPAERLESTVQSICRGMSLVGSSHKQVPQNYPQE